MRVTAIDELVIPAGKLLSVVPTATTAEPSPVAPSFNQRYHVAASGETGGWLAATFELPAEPGGPDLTALERAFKALVARHGTLRTSFTEGQEAVRIVHQEPYVWRRESIAIEGDAEQRRAQLRGALDARTRPHTFPGYALGLLISDGPAIVIAAFNHVHVDAISLAVVVKDLLAAYSGEQLDPVPSFVDYCAQRQQQPASGAQEIAVWHRFLDARAGALPRFPGDLGLGPGERAPQRVVLRQLLDEQQAADAEELARGAGGRMSAGVLAASAAAPLGRQSLGRQSLATLLAVSTRRDPRWVNSLGWFVTNVPLEIPVTDTVAGAIAATQAALDAALGLANVSLAEVLRSYPASLDLDRDVFMISYLDYRRVADACKLSAHNAHHVSASAPTDDVQVWFSRTDAGLAARVRLPDTAAARDTVDTWLDAVQQCMGELSSEPLGAPAWR